MPSSPSQNGQPDPGSIQDLLYGDPSPDRKSQLLDLLQTIWDGKWIVLGAVILTTAAAAAYTYNIPTEYRTSSLLMVDRNEESSVLSGLSRSRGSLFQEDQTLQNELLILRQSRTIANRVAERLVAMETHPDTGAPLQILRDAAGNKLSESQIAGRVKGAISAYPSGEKTNGLYISAKTGHPQEAGLIANLYAEEYIDRTKEKSREDLKASREFLEEQADSLRQDVQTAERRLQEYMSREQAVSLDQETGRIVERISDLESRRAELRIELDMKRASVESLEQEVDTIKTQLAEQISSTIEERLSRVQEEKAELDSRIETIKRENPDLSPDSPQYQNLQRLKARSAQLAQKTDSLAAQYVEESLSAGGVAGGSEGEGGVGYVADQRRTLAQKQIELNGLRARLDVLNERIRENRQSLQEIPTKSIRMAQLQRERRSAERVYNFVQEKLQEARLAEQSEVGYAEVIRPAGPGRPIGPDTRGNLLMGFLLGLGLGGGIVILRDQLDTQIHNPEDLEEHGHHVLGVVPSMTPLIDDHFDGKDVVEIDGRTVHTTLSMIVSPMSPAAESYRRIRTNLRYTKPDGRMQTLVVSSADKGDGKTTTCANLALSFASAGKKTAVVDADLRRPRMHDLLQTDRTPGLTQVLYDDTVDLSAFDTDIDDLSLIPAGDTIPNPSEVLGSGRMEQFIDTLREQYEYVLFDTPPVLLFSDVLGLTPRCDGTLLVASADDTDYRNFNHAVDLLADVDGDLLGVVLNNFDTTASVVAGYGYHYGYSYSYRQMSDYYQDRDEQPQSERSTAWWGR